MGEFVARNMLGWFKKINKRKSCCILLVVYIVELMMHGHKKTSNCNMECTECAKITWNSAFQTCCTRNTSKWCYRVVRPVQNTWIPVKEVFLFAGSYLGLQWARRKILTAVCRLVFLVRICFSHLTYMRSYTHAHLPLVTFITHFVNTVAV